MDLKDFCKSNYMDYLSNYEQNFLSKNGRFNNVANVKKQLSKQFKNVSIRGRGKKAIVYVGKSKVVVNDKADTLQDMLVSSIIFQLDCHGHSLSTWGRMLGIVTTFPPKAYMDSLQDDDKRILNWLSSFVSTRRRNYFETAYRKAVKAVGGTWSKIAIGEMTTGDTLQIPEIMEKELSALRKKLHNKGVRPTHIRDAKEYKELLLSYGYRRDWFAYLATYDQANQDAITKQGSQFTWEQVNNLFKTELLHDLKAKIDKSEVSEEVKDLLDLEIMTKEQIREEFGVVWTALENGTMLEKWEKFQPKLIVDELNTFSDDMK